jgi:hypothetical protein
MHTQRQAILALLLVVALSSCRKDGMILGPQQSPDGVASRRAGGITFTRVPTQLSPAEDSIISRIVALHPKQSDQLRQWLSDRRYVVAFPQNTSDASLQAQLAALRGNAQAAQKVVEATVVLTDELRDANADAMILRRVNMLPHDVVLLRATHATARDFRAAVKMLYAIRRRTGDVPTRDGHVSFKLPPDSTMRTGATLLVAPSTPSDAATIDAARLQEAEQREVAGIGRVRALTIGLRAVNGPR